MLKALCVAAPPSDARNVRFGSKADMCSAQAHVRFTPNSDIDCGLLINLEDHDGSKSSRSVARRLLVVGGRGSIALQRLLFHWQIADLGHAAL
jgi:hypothetical protein